MKSRSFSSEYLSCTTCREKESSLNSVIRFSISVSDRRSARCSSDFDFAAVLLDLHFELFSELLQDRSG
ncbi:MAG: hypothetical protein ACLTZY_14430 [Alistipes indistinctus]